MKNHPHPHHHAGDAPHPTCENCAHTIRNSDQRERVVCIAHLKLMPAGNTMVCDLHKLRHPRH